MDSCLVKNIERLGKKCRGKKELLNYLRTQKISLRQAVSAKCYDCIGYFVDGREDCEVETCPLYPFMQYSSLRKKLREEKKALSTKPEKKMNPKARQALINYRKKNKNA